MDFTLTRKGMRLVLSRERWFTRTDSAWALRTAHSCRYSLRRLQAQTWSITLLACADLCRGDNNSASL